MKRIGILGGGQLGRMLAQSALSYDVELHFLDPDPAAPCAGFKHFVLGDITNFEQVYQFGKDLDALTIEIEKVNVLALKKLSAEGVKIIPKPEHIELIQDKCKQKVFYQENGIPTADFQLISNKSELLEHSQLLPAFQKLGVGGYDGKGVVSLASTEQLDLAFDASSVLEKKVDIDKELAVIVARDQSGDMKCYRAIELVFNSELNLLDYLISPAQVPEEVFAECEQVAINLVQELDFVGILAIELFLSKEGQVLVNEVAPRPHNSGHHTIEAAVCSQYEQLVRLLLELPLGAPKQHAQYAAIINLIGGGQRAGEPIYQGFNAIQKIENVHVHLYGKALTKPGRKMGHITILSEDYESILALINKVKTNISIIPE